MRSKQKISPFKRIKYRRLITYKQIQTRKINWFLTNTSTIGWEFKTSSTFTAVTTRTVDTVCISLTEIVSIAALINIWNTKSHSKKPQDAYFCLVFRLYSQSCARLVFIGFPEQSMKILTFSLLCRKCKWKATSIEFYQRHTFWMKDTNSLYTESNSLYTEAVMKI